MEACVSYRWGGEGREDLHLQSKILVPGHKHQYSHCFWGTDFPPVKLLEQTQTHQLQIAASFGNPSPAMGGQSCVRGRCAVSQTALASAPVIQRCLAVGTTGMPLVTLQGSFCCTYKRLALIHTHPYEFLVIHNAGDEEMSTWGGLQGSPISAAVTAARQQAERADDVILKALHQVLCSSSPVICTSSG